MVVVLVEFGTGGVVDVVDSGCKLNLTRNDNPPINVPVLATALVLVSGGQ